MDQPLVNQNSNTIYINQINQEIQKNVYTEENVLQTQGQYQFNQQNNEQPPEQPYYLSSKNTPYEKLINFQQNQDILTNQSLSSQNDLLPPAQPYYSSSQVNYQNNYPSPNEGVIFQNQPVYNIENKNYNNFSEMKHKGIYHPKENTFNISTGCCYRCIPLIFFFIGCPLMGIPFLVGKLDGSIIPALAGFCIFICGLLACFKMYTYTSFIMGLNNLKVVKKALCWKKTLIYNPGEILRVDFIYKITDNKNDEGGISHNYSLFIIHRNEKRELILNASCGCPLFTQEEINFFLYTINNHIQTKMVGDKILSLK